MKKIAEFNVENMVYNSDSKDVIRCLVSGVNELIDAHNEAVGAEEEVRSKTPKLDMLMDMQCAQYVGRTVEVSSWYYAELEKELGNKVQIVSVVSDGKAKRGICLYGPRGPLTVTMAEEPTPIFKADGSVVNYPAPKFNKAGLLKMSVPTSPCNDPNCTEANDTMPSYDELQQRIDRAIAILSYKFDSKNVIEKAINVLNGTAEKK